MITIRIKFKKLFICWVVQINNIYLILKLKVYLILKLFRLLLIK